MRILAIALAFIAIVGCTEDGAGLRVGTTGTSSTASSAPTSTLPPVVECPGAGDFEEGGGIAEIDAEGSDTSRLGRISWDTSDQCESFVLEFETSEQAPATSVPDISIGHLETFQVIRVSLGIASTVVTEQLVETPLVDRLYVVQALDGGLFVDFHLAEPAAARARVDSSPARLTIDLRPGFVQFDGGAAVSDEVVVVSPGAGSSADPVTQFLGYARDSDADVSVIVTQGGVVVTETSTPVADSDAVWGEFRHELGLPPGNASVFVGRPGSEESGPNGVTVDLAVG